MKKSTKAKIAATVASILAVPLVVLGTHASAIGEGQIERGDIYYSKNLTSGSAFGDPTAANKCESLLYKVRMHNPGASTVTNVRVSVNLPSSASTHNVSTATITANNAFPATVSDTATVNLSTAQTISYRGGSTELLNASNVVISSLPDGITAGGVNIGSVGVSINEIRFVQFKADIGCPNIPKPPVTPPTTPPTTTTTTPPTQLVNTGPGSDAAIFAIVTVAGTIGYRYFLSRRLSRQ